MHGRRRGNYPIGDLHRCDFLRIVSDSLRLGNDRLFASTGVQIRGGGQGLSAASSPRRAPCQSCNTEMREAKRRRPRPGLSSDQRFPGHGPAGLRSGCPGRPEHSSGKSLPPAAAFSQSPDVVFRGSGVTPLLPYSDHWPPSPRGAPNPGSEYFSRSACPS